MCKKYTVNTLKLFFIITLIVPVFINAQVAFERTYGGAEDDYGYSVQQTADGGYIIAGKTKSFGHGDYEDVYLIKTDALGNTIWTSTYGGMYSDKAYSVHQTSDEGYIITGNTNSFTVGDKDVYLIKTDNTGDTLWTCTYGGADNDYGVYVQQTSDESYIIVGSTKSFGAGSNDVYLIKTDASGDTLWTRTFGTIDIDYGKSLHQTEDGGYIIAGYTGSWMGYDVYLIKTDAFGDTLWTRTFGGTANDYGYSVRQTSDGGYIIAGFTSSFGAGEGDVYLIKTNNAGDTLWTKTYGSGTDFETGNSVQQTSDGGYIIAGFIMSVETYICDVYMIRTDAYGDTLWTRTFGGAGNDQGYSVQQTSDDGYIIAGSSADDVYLVKVEGPPPAITSVCDIPNDQGGKVRITWAASLSDRLGCAYPITQYGVWRRIDQSAKKNTNNKVNGLTIEGTEEILTLEGWDAVGSVPAIQDSIYNFVSPTLIDSNTTGTNYSVFIVTAHTQDPTLYAVSDPDSGYSVDNIPPEAPYNLAGEVLNSNILLNWEIRLNYPDFSHYAVYRDMTSGFVPNDDNSIGNCDTPVYTDSAVVGGQIYYYVVSALDLNGNQGDYSNELAVTVTGISDNKPSVPTVYSLSQNYPNPFNPVTVISYGLPQNSNVELNIYNSLGQRVKTLLITSQPAGTYSIAWDGRNKAGEKVASGIYIYQLKAGSFLKTRKMILIR